MFMRYIHDNTHVQNLYIQTWFKVLSKQQFRWKNDIVDDFIKNLENFKALIEFKGKHFDDDRQAQYTVLPKELC